MAYRLDKRAARARLALGAMLHQVGKDDCAAEVYRAGLAYDPGLVEAHVALGFAYGRLVQYEEMIGAFAEAVRLDRRGAIEAAREEPPEVERIREVLYGAGPAEPEGATEGTRWPAGLPAPVREAAELVEAALKRLGEAWAVDALERAVRLDPASADNMSMLALAYLLLPEEEWEARGGRSVLWEASPWLARLFFGQ
jgi:tetratricopeptide (TPR) repeat protein